MVMTEKPIFFTQKSDVPSNAKIVDAFDSSLRELFFVENPQYKKGMPGVEEKLEAFLKSSDVKEVWVYYPWNNIVVRSVPEDLYFALRTARNRNIITKEEQAQYRNVKVGVVGLSVGSAVLSALVISGGPKTLKIADFDVVEVSNLNRIRAKLTDAGTNKCVVAAREVWELDPFADVHVWDKGVAADTIEQFIIGEPKLDVFVDEMDSIDMKIAARMICKRMGIPVLMATDNGDSVILDVERFDAEPERQPFHGLIGDRKPEEARGLPFKEWVRLATKIVGPEYLPETMQRSLLEMGRSIAAVPQLGTTAHIAGAAMSYVVRRIANKQDMPSGRYVISLEEKLVPGYNDAVTVKHREESSKAFAKTFLG